MMIYLFGMLAEEAGDTKWQLPFCEDTNQLMEEVYRRFPAWKSYSLLLSVNRKLIQENQNIQSGDELALMPPFSGG
ncbi:MAG TPA: MoaD/ThiS family protein [Chitinophagaceae bacterium]|nr:MoaD/ThiS family protein [Chitinophagaceae bacterium]